MKSYIIIAGVNGAGKTTLFNTNQMFGDIVRVNLDETVRKMGGSWKNQRDVGKAGMICVRKIQECIQKGLSFNQETTLCGKSVINNILKAKEKDFRIELYYVGLDSPELAKKRIRERVRNGGHGIPEEDVDRRYYESLRNLKAVFPICDKADIFDNSEEFNKVAEFIKGERKWQSEKVPKWYLEAMN